MSEAWQCLCGHAEYKQIYRHLADGGLLGTPFIYCLRCRLVYHDADLALRASQPKGFEPSRLWINPPKAR